MTDYCERSGPERETQTALRANSLCTVAFQWVRGPVVSLADPLLHHQLATPVRYAGSSRCKVRGARACSASSITQSRMPATH